MKLYYYPGACSLSPHIALREAGLKFDLEQVDFETGRTKKGEDFAKVNPKGYVPALMLDDGQVLTETATIVQYIADKAPGAKLAPQAGTMERYRLQEWLNYIATELHKSFGPLFASDTPKDYQEIVKKNLAKRFDYLEKHLAGRQHLTDSGFTIADGYCFTVLGWAGQVGISLDKWPNIKAYHARIAARPAVAAALKAEGLS